MIRIGNDEFRFYADSPPASPKSAPKMQAVEIAPSRPPAGASQRLSETMHGIPVAELQRQNTPPSPSAAPLASLLFRSGDMKGRRLPIKVPVANIGRGDYNDVVISDPSVSTMHAKLQRRDAIWILTDLGSTNGTFVEGEPLKGELPLGPGTTIRFVTSWRYSSRSTTRSGGTSAEPGHGEVGGEIPVTPAQGAERYPKRNGRDRGRVGPFASPNHAPRLPQLLGGRVV